MTEVSQAALSSASGKGEGDTAPAKQRPQPLPTVRKLAEATDTHPATIYRAIADGEIAAIKIRGTIRIPWREFRRLTGEA